MIAGQIAAGLSICAWLYLLLFRGGFWRVREQPPPRRKSSASVAVIIPARNEADVIGAAVASLCAQQYDGAIRLYVVDDSSTDGTGAAARAAGPADCVTVIEAPSLEPGWTGKLWALHHGVQAAREADFILFTDADIVHGPASVESLVARAEADNLDLASYMVLLHCRTLAERALVPAFVFFFFMLYPPAWIRRPQRSDAGAAGGCILLRPSALRRVGGVAALRNALIDDCTLARLVKRNGGRVWLGVTRETRSIREYGTFGEIERMVARTAYTQLRYSPLLLAGTILGMALIYVAPVYLAALGYWLAWAALLLMFAVFLPIVRFYGQAWPWAAALPLIAAFYMTATLHSAWQHWRGRGGQWKGRIQS